MKTKIVTEALTILPFCLSFFLLTGCKKDEIAPLPTRKIRFELFADQDFSQEANSIVFEPSISMGNTVLWDSTFTPMKLKNIPREPQKIIFEKNVVNTDSELKVGFKYSIENVGISWHYEKATGGVPSKTVILNFK